MDKVLIILMSPFTKPESPPTSYNVGLAGRNLEGSFGLLKLGSQLG